MSMVLEFDLGNTRLKWRLLDAAGRRLAGGAEATTDFGRPWRPALERAAAPCRSARVSSVAAAEVNERLQQQLKEDGVRHLCFARAGAACGQVRAGYREPQRMGVDRWLAVIAAWERCRAPVVVVDAGSALTVDLVEASGQHLGGWIVPGLQLMRQSLLSGTAGIRLPDGVTGGDFAVGRDTGEAVGFGTLAMMRDFVNRRYAEFAASRPGAMLALTGGDADQLTPDSGVRAAVLNIPELVMDGLAFALPGTALPGE